MNGIEFRDRIEAGRRLAERLRIYTGHPRVIVIGLAPGGVVVGQQIAKTLRLPLDVLTVHRVVDYREARTIGAVAAGGVRVMNDHLPRWLRRNDLETTQIANDEQVKADRRQRILRGNRAPIECTKQIIVIADDGTATGAMLRAAVQTIARQQPERVILATPVCAQEIVHRTSGLIDRVVSLATTDPFHSAAAAYEDFPPVSDGVVIALLRGVLPPTRWGRELG